MTAVYTPSAPGDAERLERLSPDLMSLDDKLTAALGPSDPATDAWVTASLAIGKADCVRRPRGGEHRG